MNDYDEEVHRNAASVSLFVLSTLISYGVFFGICCALLEWWNS